MRLVLGALAILCSAQASADVVTNVLNAGDAISIPGERWETEVSFDIPKDTISFLLQAEEANGRSVLFTSLVGPNGEVFVGKTLPPYEELEKTKSADALVKAQLSKLRVELQQVPGVHALLIPNFTHPALVAPGTWRAKAISGSSSKLVFRLVRKTGKAVPAASSVGRLPLRVTLLAENETDLASYGPQFEKLKAKLPELFRKLNLNVEARYETGLRNKQDKLPDLLKRYGDRESLNLILLNYGGRTAGMSLARPGPAFNANSVPGAVLVNLAEGFDAEELAGVIIHEAGHYLALPHTCEMGVPLTDEIDDTACSRDNLMYPVDGFGTFTPQQIEIVHKHPLVFP